ncbi:MAG: iron chaperone, partial [Gammaproteobacteria bacterium]
EKLSYQMPAFTLNGDLIYFAAFKKHIGLYPPVMGDENLRKVTSRYKGEKGNLKFPLDEPIPYALIGRVVKFRVKEHLERVASKRRKK